MATIKSTERKHGPGTHTGRTDLPVTRVDVTFTLSAAEAKLLPPNNRMARVFGPAGRYESMVTHQGGEVTVSYYMSSLPFQTSNHNMVPSLALKRFNAILGRLAQG